MRGGRERRRERRGRERVGGGGEVGERERDGIWKGKRIKENWYDWHSVLDKRSSVSLDSEGSSSNLKST